MLVDSCQRGAGRSPAGTKLGDPLGTDRLDRFQEPVMLDIVAILALLPAAPLAADEYEFTINTIRLMRLYRVEGRETYYLNGWLDAAGNFVPPIVDEKWLGWLF